MGSKETKEFVISENSSPTDRLRHNGLKEKGCVEAGVSIGRSGETVCACCGSSILISEKEKNPKVEGEDNLHR